MNKIDVGVNSSKVNIGDHIIVKFKLPLNLDLSKGNVEFVHSFGQIGDVSEEGLSLVSAPGLNENLVTVELASYKPGKMNISSMKIKVDGEEVFETSPTVIDVVGKQGELKLVDIRGPKELPPSFLYYGSLLLTFAIVLFIFWKLYKKFFYKKRIDKGIKQKYVSPYEKALQALSQIGKDKELTRKVLVTRVTETLRRFLDEEYSLNIMDLTTKELLRVLKKESRFEIPIVNELKTYFDKADYVKFKNNDEQENVDFINEAKKFINMLRRQQDEI